MVTKELLGFFKRFVSNTQQDLKEEPSPSQFRLRKTDGETLTLNSGEVIVLFEDERGLLKMRVGDEGENVNIIITEKDGQTPFLKMVTIKWEPSKSCFTQVERLDRDGQAELLIRDGQSLVAFDRKKGTLSFPQGEIIFEKL